jgi:hypothetical protein
MDFNQLMAKMRELDQPVSPTTEDCGMMPPAMPTASTPPTAPPSMSLNLNAQGMDNIESLMKLLTKVNPDMINQPKEPAMPSLSAPPSIMSIKPSEPPLKMLPDLSDEPSDELPPNHDKDHQMVKALDKDGDGDHDMDDHDIEKKNKEEDYANAPDEKYMGMDAAVPDGNDLNKPKRTFPKVAGGDNPMQRMEGTDLRAQIRAELQQRLSEAKQK